MRFPVAILLVLVQAAGPWLCCCGAPRLLAAPTPAAPRPEKPAETAHHCPHCPRPPADPSDPPAPAPKGRPGDCPEGVKCSWVIPDAVPAELSNPADHARPDAAPPFPPGPLDRPPPAALAADGPDLPFLSTEARLYAHHVLRC